MNYIHRMNSNFPLISYSDSRIIYIYIYIYTMYYTNFRYQKLITKASEIYVLTSINNLSVHQKQHESVFLLILSNHLVMHTPLICKRPVKITKEGSLKIVHQLGSSQLFCMEINIIKKFIYIMAKYIDCSYFLLLPNQYFAGLS